MEYQFLKYRRCAQYCMKDFNLQYYYMNIEFIIILLCFKLSGLHFVKVLQLNDVKPYLLRNQYTCNVYNVYARIYMQKKGDTLNPNLKIQISNIYIVKLPKICLELSNIISLEPLLPWKTILDPHMTSITSIQVSI